MSNQRSTTKFASNQQAPLTPSFERTGITDIRYFIEGYVLHHKSHRHSPHTVEFHAWWLRGSRRHPVAHTPCYEFVVAVAGVAYNNRCASGASVLLEAS
jgi:hypothetical protein